MLSFTHPFYRAICYISSAVKGGIKMAKAHFYLTQDSSSIAHGCLHNPLDTGSECSKIAKDRVLWEHRNGSKNDKRNPAMRANNFTGGYTEILWERREF